MEATNITEYVGTKDMPIVESKNPICNKSLPTFSSDIKDDGAFDYQFNSKGLRSDEFSEGELVSIGCSICFGVGVPQNDRTSARLAQKLELRDINLAWPCKSLEYCHRMLNWAVPALKPKFVFVQSPETSRREHLCSIIGTYDHTAKKQYYPDFLTSETNEAYELYMKATNPSHRDLIYYNTAVAIENLLERHHIEWAFLIPKKASQKVTDLLVARSRRYVRMRGSIDLGRDGMHPGSKSHEMWSEGLQLHINGKEIPEDYLPTKC